MYIIEKLEIFIYIRIKLFTIFLCKIESCISTVFTLMIFFIAENRSQEQYFQTYSRNPFK